MISEEQARKIREEAKLILNRFASSLESVEIKKMKRLKISKGGFRVEGKGNEADEEFVKTMFENAPEVDMDCIVAEKKKW